MQPGDIVVRHDQPANQGTIANVAGGAIVFVYWHGRSPSYEHIRDLVTLNLGQPPIKKAAAHRRRPVLES